MTTVLMRAGLVVAILLATHDVRSEMTEATSTNLFAINRSLPPPTNWILAVSTQIRPYETFDISISGPEFKEHWVLSTKTKIDGKEINSDPQQGTLDVQGWQEPQGQHGLNVCVSFFPVFRFPRSLGRHSIDLVIEAGTNEYHFARRTVLLEATPEERRQLAAFELSGANRFLDDAYGYDFDDGGTEGNPYKAVSEYVARYPASYLTKLIEDRIQLIWFAQQSQLHVEWRVRYWLSRILFAKTSQVRTHVCMWCGILMSVLFGFLWVREVTRRRSRHRAVETSDNIDFRDNERHPPAGGDRVQRLRQLVDVHKMKTTLIKLLLIAILIGTNWFLIQRWAMPPGWWGGSMLRGGDETDLHTARRYFGPILFHKTWLCYKDNPEAFRLWGQLETDYRLIAISVGNLCLTVVLVAVRRKQTPTTTST